LTDPDKLYLVATDLSGQLIAFVILAGLTSKAHSIELARMAVVRPGTGIGKPLLKDIIDMAFNELKADRLWLDVFTDNGRALHTYKAVGFREEGVLQEASLRNDGQLGSLVIMSILAKEYRAGLGH
jgi:diamine N-acetyltransferase